MTMREWERPALATIVPQYDHRGRRKTHRCALCERQAAPVIVADCTRWRGKPLCQYCYYREVSRAKPQDVT